jgi:hypothetical protein
VEKTSGPGEKAVVGGRFLCGNVSYSDQDNTYTMTTGDGKKYSLARSQRMDTVDTLNAGVNTSWMRGLVKDGPMAVHGTLGADGKTFNVEGFALNTDGNYSTFTQGRAVKTDDGRVVVKGPRGDVEVTDPDLKARLAAMPRLGVILPGEPTLQGDKLVYDKNPKEYYGLARFSPPISTDVAARTPEVPGEPGTKYAPGEMAMSVFSRKPIVLPPGAESRVDHNSRIWVRGTPEGVTEAGATQFRASYVSLATDPVYNATARRNDGELPRSTVSDAPNE